VGAAPTTLVPHRHVAGLERSRSMQRPVSAAERRVPRFYLDWKSKSKRVNGNIDVRPEAERNGTSLGSWRRGAFGGAALLNETVLPTRQTASARCRFVFLRPCLRCWLLLAGRPRGRRLGFRYGCCHCFRTSGYRSPRKRQFEQKIEQRWLGQDGLDSLSR